MLRVFADNHDFAFSLDDLALFADFLNGRFNLHLYQPFLSSNFFKPSNGSFRAPGDAALGQVIYRHLNGHTVTGQNADIVHAKLTRNVSRHDVTVRELHLEAGVGQCLNNRAFKFDYVILLCQNNPS